MTGGPTDLALAIPSSKASRPAVLPRHDWDAPLALADRLAHRLDDEEKASGDVRDGGHFGTNQQLEPDGERIVVPGSFVDLPAGLAHGFRNDGTDTARLLAIATPVVQLAALFRHFDGAHRAPGGLPPSEAPAICAKYGVTFVG